MILMDSNGKEIRLECVGGKLIQHLHAALSLCQSMLAILNFQSTKKCIQSCFGDGLYCLLLAIEIL